MNAIEKKVYERIGTVTVVNNARLWPLDAASSDPVLGVYANVGTECPLYSDGMSIFWVISGYLNAGGFQPKGDGLAMSVPWDIESNIEVTVPSPVFGQDDWARFLTEPHTQEGSPEQRLQIDVWEK